MRICMFGWELPPSNSGGLGTACFGLTRALKNHGADMFFVLPKKMRAEAPHMEIKFADEKEAADLYPSPYAKGEESVPGSGGLSLIEEVKRYGQLARSIARRNHFNVIHAHDWLSFPAGWNAKEVSGRPFIAHVHATEFDRTGGGDGHPEVEEIEYEGLTRADRVVTVSGYTKNIISKKYKIPPEKISVIHNGADADQIPQSHGRAEILSEYKKKGYKIILFVGRITIQKGPDYFIKLARRVADFDDKVIFLIAGSGDMKNQVLEEAVGMGIGDKVFFAGFVRGGELSAVYRSADLYIMPSVSEPFGLTPLEALHHGTPVLVSKQSGVSEVINNAFKADFWDVDDMANKVISALKYAPLHRTLKEESMKEVQDLTWQGRARDFMELYANLTSNQPIHG